MKINLIWAQAKNRVIGLKGKMPWHLPEDMAHFKKTTLGYPVIMGRKTWDSIPPKFRPLPGRMNVVITRDASAHEKFSQIGVKSSPNIDGALSICEQSGSKEVWVIGGAQIYAQTLPLAHRAVITQIDAEFEGDAFAPELDANWHEVQRSSLTTANGFQLDFIDYHRIRAVDGKH